MNLILPKYLLRKKYFHCNVCGVNYWKETPSDVDKCPICEKEGRGVRMTLAKDADIKHLDKYSQWKARIYSDVSGQRHIDDIKHRSIQKVGGKKETVWKDNNNNILDRAPVIPISDNKKNKRYNLVK